MTVHRRITSCFPRRLTQLVEALLPSDQRVSWQPCAYCFLLPIIRKTLQRSSRSLILTDPLFAHLPPTNSYTQAGNGSGQKENDVVEYQQYYGERLRT